MEELLSECCDVPSERDPIYLNFWHHIVDTEEVHNGCYIHFCEDDLNQDYSYVDEMFKKYGDQDGRCKDESHDGKWINTIIGYILDEYGEGDNRECEFYVSW